MGTTAFWYASRATGVVALLLLTGVLVLGMLVNRQGRLPGLPRFAVTSLDVRAAKRTAIALSNAVQAVIVQKTLDICLISVSSCAKVRHLTPAGPFRASNVIGRADRPCADRRTAQLFRFKDHQARRSAL